MSRLLGLLPPILVLSSKKCKARHAVRAIRLNPAVCIRTPLYICIVTYSVNQALLYIPVYLRFFSPYPHQRVRSVCTNRHVDIQAPRASLAAIIRSLIMLILSPNLGSGWPPKRYFRSHLALNTLSISNKKYYLLICTSYAMCGDKTCT